MVAGCSPAARRAPPSDAAAVTHTGDRPSAPSAAPSFLDRAQPLGIDAGYHNGEEAGRCSILESLGGGVGWFDYDRDGWLDLVAPGGGRFADGPSLTGEPTTLWRSVPGAEGPARRFAGVAGVAGLDTLPLYTHGVAIGDFDNDGFPDLVVTGYGPAQLWHNLGDGGFAPVSDWPAVADPRWSSSAGWADLDGDGDLDLYLARYVDWSFEHDPFCGRSPRNATSARRASSRACPTRSIATRGTARSSRFLARRACAPTARGLASCSPT